MNFCFLLTNMYPHLHTIVLEVKIGTLFFSVKQNKRQKIKNKKPRIKK